MSVNDERQIVSTYVNVIMKPLYNCYMLIKNKKNHNCCTDILVVGTIILSTVDEVWSPRMSINSTPVHHSLAQIFEIGIIQTNEPQICRTKFSFLLPFLLDLEF
jgi:hypothetical protein